MSATEYVFKDSEYILREVIKSISKYDGLIFYSIFLKVHPKKQENFCIKYHLLFKKKIIQVVLTIHHMQKNNTSLLFFIKLIKKKLYKKIEKLYSSLSRNL